MGMAGICIVHHVQQPTCAGAGLLDLPEDLLQAVASHFNAAEWARGPSRTCHHLHQMPLTRLAMPQQVEPSPSVLSLLSVRDAH